MRNFFILLVGIVVLYSCSSSKSQATPEQLLKFKNTVEGKSFEINSDKAYPQATNALQNSGLIAPGNSANLINLSGNVNYLRIVNDSIYAELPYFGERRMTASYNGSDSTIKIEDVIQNYKVVTKGDVYKLSFRAKAKTEEFRFNITLFPNLKTSMIVDGSTRVPIEYTGVLKPL